MSKCAIAPSSRENSPIVLKYDYKYCPSCGSAISSPVLVSIELDEPELGFAGDLSRYYDYSDDVMISWKDCVLFDGFVRDGHSGKESVRLTN